MIADAVVIGGGPAGSSAAIRLARAGFKVRLYEKARFPRAKLCGGFLSTESFADLKDLNILDSLRESGAVPLHRTVIASPCGAIIEAVLPHPAISVSRDVMDALLMREAEHAGVQVFHGEDGFAHADLAPRTVIAAGRMALPRDLPVKKRLTPWYSSPSTLYFGIQALFDDVRDVSDQVELDLIESGYVGLARQAGGVNVCTLTTSDTIRRYGPSLDDVMKRFTIENPTLKGHLSGARRISDWKAVPVRLGIRQIVRGQTFYTGDAACVVDPFAGEGMSIGLYSSNLLQRAFSQDRIPAGKLYEKLWRQAFVPALRWNALTRMLYSLPFIKKPATRALQWFPGAINWMTDLTRCRRVLDTETV
jgi:menaquinone-9 beta-reductase